MLKTTEGGLIDNAESIAIVLDANISKLKTQINGWKIPPLSVRYSDICQEEKIKVDDDLCKLFHDVVVFHSVNLSNLGLKSTTLFPIFKALKHEINLRTLDLTNNDMSRSELEQLIKILPKLVTLEKLKLGNNFLSVSVLRCLDECLKDNVNALKRLSELNLEYTHFGDSGIPHLKSIVNQLGQLKKLSICGCGITDLTKCILDLHKLTSFDISYNRDLKFYSIKQILGKCLDASRISALNFSGSVPMGYLSFAQHIGEFLERGVAGDNISPRMLTDLSLMQCQLSDDDLVIIIEALNQYAGVEKLKLSLNKFTGLGFKMFFSCRFRIQQLYLNGCWDLLNGLTVPNLSGNEEFEGIKFPKQIQLSTPTRGGKVHAEQMETLRIIWEKCWGYNGRICDEKGKVQMYVQ